MCVCVWGGGVLVSVGEVGEWEGAAGVLNGTHFGRTGNTPRLSTERRRRRTGSVC